MRFVQRNDHYHARSHRESRVMGLYLALMCLFNTLRPGRNEQHFADDIFKRIFFNENAWISIKISLKFVPKGPINNIPALIQMMAWRRSGDKPLSEPMMVNLLTHICVTRPQWVKTHIYLYHLLFLNSELVVADAWNHSLKSFSGKQRPVCPIYM